MDPKPPKPGLCPNIEDMPNDDDALPKVGVEEAPKAGIELPKDGDEEAPNVVVEGNGGEDWVAPKHTS